MNIKPSKDANGNTTVRVSFGKGAERGFSIQTNGNMPRTHRSITWDCQFDRHVAENELHGYIKQHGTARQKDLLGW